MSAKMGKSVIYFHINLFLKHRDYTIKFIVHSSHLNRSGAPGAVTAMVGKVGTDGFGTQTFENFKNLGVDTTYLLSTNDAPTGTTMFRLIYL